MKTILAVLFAVIFSIAAAACSGISSTSNKADGGQSSQEQGDCHTNAAIPCPGDVWDGENPVPDEPAGLMEKAGDAVSGVVASVKGKAANGGGGSNSNFTAGGRWFFWVVLAAWFFTWWLPIKIDNYAISIAMFGVVFAASVLHLLSGIPILGWLIMPFEWVLRKLGGQSWWWLIAGVAYTLAWWKFELHKMFGGGALWNLGTYIPIPKWEKRTLWYLGGWILLYILSMWA